MQEVLRHIGSVHSHEPDFQVLCRIGGCSRSYTNFRSFQKHNRQIHIASLQENDDSGVPPDDPLFVPEDEGDAHHDPDDAPIIANKKSLKRNAALFLLKTKEMGQVSQVALNIIVFGVSNFMQVQMDELQQRVKSILRSNDVQDEVVAAIDQSFNKEDISQQFAGLDSEYLQKYFTEELNMLVSKQI